MRKSMKSSPRTPHTDVDVSAAVLCGDAALPFIKSVPPDRAEAARYAAENIGDMSAASVNLAFTIEIYLKALIAATGNSFPNEHSLLILFDQLQKDIQEKIKSEFDVATGNQQKSDTATAALLVEVTRQSSGRGTAQLKAYPKGIRALLQRNARNFLAWRYLFSSETKEGSPLSFEFHNLVVVATILRRLFPEDIRMQTKPNA